MIWLLGFVGWVLMGLGYKVKEPYTFFTGATICLTILILSI